MSKRMEELAEKAIETTRGLLGRDRDLDEVFDRRNLVWANETFKKVAADFKQQMAAVPPDRQGIYDLERAVNLFLRPLYVDLCIKVKADIKAKTYKQLMGMAEVVDIMDMAKDDTTTETAAETATAPKSKGRKAKRATKAQKTDELNAIVKGLRYRADLACRADKPILEMILKDQKGLVNGMKDYWQGFKDDLASLSDAQRDALINPHDIDLLGYDFLCHVYDYFKAAPPTFDEMRQRIAAYIAANPPAKVETPQAAPAVDDDAPMQRSRRQKAKPSRIVLASLVEVPNQAIVAAGALTLEAQARVYKDFAAKCASWYLEDIGAMEEARNDKVLARRMKRALNAGLKQEFYDRLFDEEEVDEEYMAAKINAAIYVGYSIAGYYPPEEDFTIQELRETANYMLATEAATAMGPAINAMAA